MKIVINKEKIDEILTRSVDSIYPSKKALRGLLLSGKRIKVYVGIDPTANYVHLGHTTNYLILERLHKLGHKIIVLVGDFTAMVGDPSDKTSARTPLTKKQVLKNLKSFKTQIGKILNFTDKKNPVEFRFNSEWLSELDFEKIIDLSSNFTVQQMIERDMFEKRIQENKPLFIHEFFYPLMQGYDSVALKVDLEIGGTDQTFNMLAGRTLAKRYLDKEKFVITTTLLVNPITGEKLMSKSLGTGITLNETADDMFGKVMALPDEGIIQTFIDCTRIPLPEIKKNKQRLKKGENPRDIKLELAREIVNIYHGKEEGSLAQKNWEQTFTNKELPEHMPELNINKGETVANVLVKRGIVSSKNDWKRLVQQGAVRDANSKEINDPDFIPKHDIILKIGKRRFVKLTIK